MILRNPFGFLTLWCRLSVTTDGLMKLKNNSFARWLRNSRYTSNVRSWSFNNERMKESSSLDQLWRNELKWTGTVIHSTVADTTRCWRNRELAIGVTKLVITENRFTSIDFKYQKPCVMKFFNDIHNKASLRNQNNFIGRNKNLFGDFTPWVPSYHIFPYTHSDLKTRRQDHCTAEKNIQGYRVFRDKSAIL